MSEQQIEPYVTLMACAGDQGFSDQVRFDNNARHKDEAEVVYITKKHWQEMGSPDVVTMTIAPASIIDPDKKF